MTRLSLVLAAIAALAIPNLAAYPAFADWGGQGYPDSARNGGGYGGYERTSGATYRPEAKATKRAYGSDYVRLHSAEMDLETQLATARAMGNHKEAARIERELDKVGRAIRGIEKGRDAARSSSNRSGGSGKDWKDGGKPSAGNGWEGGN